MKTLRFLKVIKIFLFHAFPVSVGGGVRRELVKNAVFGLLEKLLYIGLFKITTFWPPLDERIRSSFAEICKKYSHYLQNSINSHGFYV